MTKSNVTITQAIMLDDSMESIDNNSPQIQKGAKVDFRNDLGPITSGVVLVYLPDTHEILIRQLKADENGSDGALFLRAINQSFETIQKPDNAVILGRAVNACPPGRVLPPYEEILALMDAQEERDKAK